MTKILTLLLLLNISIFAVVNVSIDAQINEIKSASAEQRVELTNKYSWALLLFWYNIFKLYLGKYYEKNTLWKSRF